MLIFQLNMCYVIRTFVVSCLLLFLFFIYNQDFIFYVFSCVRNLDEKMEGNSSFVLMWLNH